MELVARVTELRELARPIADGPPEQAIAIGFDIDSQDADLPAMGSKMVLVLPRVLGKRWALGMMTRLHLEDITNGSEKNYSFGG